MKRNIKYRALFVVAVIVICVSYLCVSRSAGRWKLHLPFEKINLGLDLKGGIHLVLQVTTADAFEAEANEIRDRIQSDLRERGVVFTSTRVTEDFRVEILGILRDQEDALEDYLSPYELNWTSQIRYREDELDAVTSMNSAYAKELANLTVRQAKETITKRVDQYGVVEPTISIYGSGDVKDQIIVELPGVEDFDRVLNLIKSTARLELKLVHSTQGGPYPTRESALQAFNGAIPSDHEVLRYPDATATQGRGSFMVVREGASITGQHLKNARRSQDSFTGRSEVEFSLNAEGVRRFSQTTEQNVGNRLAIVLDDEIRSAPNIEEKITSEVARISGNFSPEEAQDLALVLRSGALPAGIEILENRIIGPSLGMDSIRRGMLASLVGLVLVVAGMLVVYRVSGMNAILCLFLNLLILLGVLAYFHATLTLPGIAGVILTIGMAVDANILIFERIKEEIRVGKTVRSSVDAGFDRVFSTIIDTNITTLVAALFLFQFGTGPVRGFAVTLAVGLIANIFTAVFVSRTIFGLVLQKWEVKQLSI